MTGRSNGVYRDLLSEPGPHESEWELTGEPQFEGASPEWETPSGEWEGQPEGAAPMGEWAGEWGTPESQFELGAEAGLESLGLEAAGEAWTEGEWELQPEVPSHEAEWEALTGLPEFEGYTSPAQAAPEHFEYEWEGAGAVGEADPLLPLMAAAPLMAKLGPLAMKYGLPLAKKLMPHAGKAARQVLRSLLGGRRRRRPTSSGFPPLPGTAGIGGLSPQAVAQLLRRLSGALAEGEQVAVEAEAVYFGETVAEGELGAGTAAHEAALTEVLAAEAAHAELTGEAESLCAATIPMVISIVPAGGLCRPYVPALIAANRGLVQGLRSSGPAGRQMLRVTPAVYRRTVATLARGVQSGRPLPVDLVPVVVAGHARRMLGNRSALASAVARNVAVRRATVAAPGRRIVIPPA